VSVCSGDIRNLVAFSICLSPLSPPWSFVFSFLVLADWGVVEFVAAVATGCGAYTNPRQFQAGATLSLVLPSSDPQSWEGIAQVDLGLWGRSPRSLCCRRVAVPVSMVCWLVQDVHWLKDPLRVVWPWRTGQGLWCNCEVSAGGPRDRWSGCLCAGHTLFLSFPFFLFLWLLPSLPLLSPLPRYQNWFSSLAFALIPFSL
jgi:hypothetical protein